MKALTYSSVLWFLLLCGLFVFATPLLDFLWFFYLPIHWGVLAVGIGISVAGIVSLPKKRAATAVPLFICALGITLFFTEGFKLGRLALFQLRKGQYESLLQVAMRDKQASNEEVPVEEGGYAVDSGPPARYAFLWQRGMTDNWVAVIHDASGAVDQVNEIPDIDSLHDERWSAVVGLFGGHIYRCEHLQGPWYLCWFT